MAVAEFTTPLDLEKIRADFPILAQPVHGKRLVFLDSAASSQKPRQVIDTLVDVYETSYANVHRGVYYLGARATERYEGARDIMAGFINANDRREVIFVREATEALNLVAYAYGRTFVGAGDAIVATEMEHHSNLVPWQFLAQQTGATLHYLRLTDDGSLDPDSQERLAAIENVKLVAVAHVSNSLGTINDIPALAALGARSRRRAGGRRRAGRAHRPVDVQALGCDFYAFSGHKMCGPGAGILWGRAELLERMAAVPDRRRDDPHGRAGADDLERAALEVRGRHARRSPSRSRWAPPPSTCRASAWRRSRRTSTRSPPTPTTCFDGIGGVTQYGPKPPNRARHPQLQRRRRAPPRRRPGARLARASAVRAGHHCTQPLMRRFDLNATTRASVYLYNGRDDIDALALGIEKVKRTFAV